jgi:parallel beta-helix repeat protein
MKACVTHKFLMIFLLLVVLPLTFIEISEAATRQIIDNSTGGDCIYIGTWNARTKTCTLTADLWDPVQINSNGVTLHGNGYAIRGIPRIDIIGELFVPGSGVTLNGVARVTVTHVTVDNFEVGIYLNGVTNARVLHNSLPNSYVGIQLDYSNENEIIGNDLYLVGYGIELNTSANNYITGNVNSGGC